jgi:hypothetical protein
MTRPALDGPLGGPYADGPDAYEPEDLALWGSFTLDECDAQAAFARSCAGRYSPSPARFPRPLAVVPAEPEPPRMTVEEVARAS